MKWTFFPELRSMFSLLENDSPRNGKTAYFPQRANGETFKIMKLLRIICIVLWE